MVTTPMPTILGSYPDFFSPDFLDLQAKSKEKCELALFNGIVRYGKKSEEILWNKIYHEPMQVYKRMKNTATSQDIKALQLHFISGVGFYTNLLKRLFSEYHIDNIYNLADPIKELRFSENFPSSKKHSVSAREKEAASTCIHAVFIRLGDIFRYLDSLGYPMSQAVAIRWYHGAIIFQPSNGMPYNQLGTLMTGNNYGLDSAYFYMRCLLSDKTFDGAEGNLKPILISCPKFLQDEFRKNREAKANDPTYLVKKCIIQLLVVAGEIFNLSKRQHGMRIASAIQDFLTTLAAALELPAKANNPQKPSYLDPSLIYKMGTMSLMFLTHLQVSYIDSGILYSAAIALALNFLIFNVSAFIRQFKEKIGEMNLFLSNANPKTNGLPENYSPSARTSKANTPELSPRRALSRLRRRKAAITYDDVDTDLLNFEDDSDLSEAEETALSTFDALEIGSDISETGSVCDEEYNLKSSDDEEQPTDSANLRDPCALNKNADVNMVLRHLYCETNLPTIKALCDWLRVDEELVSYSVQSISALFSQFSEMLNLLKDLETRVLNSNPDLEKFKYTGPEWKQKYPLSSDFNLIKLKLFDKFYESVLDRDKEKETLSSEEMGFLCMECIVSFGHFLEKNKNKIDTKNIR